MNDPDIRWQQRFANFKKALQQLQEAVELRGQRELSKLEKQGVIQAFEFTHELAWNVLKDYLQDQGNQNISGSKDATHRSLQGGAHRRRRAMDGDDPGPKHLLAHLRRTDRRKTGRGHRGAILPAVRRIAVGDGEAPAVSAAPPFGLPPATLDKLNSVFARHPAIASVLIYGSRAKGTHRPGSDIDLTIKGEDIPFAEFMQIEDQIDDLMLPYTVDLSQYRQLGNAELIAHIDRVGVVIYGRDGAATLPSGAQR